MKQADLKVGEYYAIGRNRKGQLIETGVYGMYSRRKDASLMMVEFDNGATAVRTISNRDILRTWAEQEEQDREVTERAAAERAVEEALDERVTAVAEKLGLQHLLGSREYSYRGRGVKRTAGHDWDAPVGQRSYPAVEIPLDMIEEALGLKKGSES